MGKKRIVRKSGGEGDGGRKTRSLSKIPKKHIESGVLHIQATYNNTTMTLTDSRGGTVMWATTGTLGFEGAKRGTPFAAAKVGELMGEKAAGLGVKEVNVIIRGVGAGRESSLRAFASKGITISSIRDATPIPFNGPRPPKPRRV